MLFKSITNRSLIVFSALFLLVLTKADAGWDVGDGGDQMKLIFEKGRNDAVTMLRAFDVNAPSVPVDQRVLEFLNRPAGGVSLRDALMNDVASAQHLWIPGDGSDNTPVQKLCALTNLPGQGNAIRFSLDACENHLRLSGEGETAAVALILHEAAHHFGLDDSPENDALASQMALAVIANWREHSSRSDSRWSEVPLADAPDPRYLHSAVWTSSPASQMVANRLLVWGGCNYSILPNRENCAHQLASGGQLIFKSETDENPSWFPMSIDGAPSPRQNQTAVWAQNGSFAQMIVFGGCSGENARCDQFKGDGASYNPETDSWRSLPTENAPAARIFHTSVWTGSEMLVWGGLSQNEANEIQETQSGGTLRIDDSGDGFSWRPLRTENAPSQRFGHTAIWTGTEMIVWGGCERRGITRCARALSDGGRYDPRTGQWRVMRRAPEGMERTDFSSVWTGRGMIVWGGKNGSEILSSGAFYDAENDTWTPLPTLLPEGEGGRFSHSASWDSERSHMIIWGGEGQNGFFPQTTLLFSPRSANGRGSWSLLETEVSPIGRRGHASVWTGSRMLIWGGFGANETFLSTGGILQMGARE